MFHQGVYRLKRPEKYRGDPDKCVYRSGWERSTFIWLEKHPNVVAWSSEETFIPYVSPIDGDVHRYFVDLQIWMKDGTRWMIEIKPKCQTEPPKRPKRQTRRYLEECATYAVNQAKWDAAKQAAENTGAKFAVWDEDTLRKLGVKII